MREEERRCWGDEDPLMAIYHDEEWGVTVHEDRLLFEHLVLDGFQAGLSWRTILHKRENFRRAFDNFDPDTVAGYGEMDLDRLLNDAGIVRNRQKIQAAITNAKALLEVQKEFGSFDAYIWRFTGFETLYSPSYVTWEEIPTTSLEAEAMSKDLKARGFKFVGPTICYAFMQAVGIVDDHLVGCLRYRER